MSFIVNVKDTDKFFPWNLDIIARMYLTSGVDKSVGEDNKDYIYAMVIFRLAKNILNQLFNPFINPENRKPYWNALLKQCKENNNLSKCLSWILQTSSFLNLNLCQSSKSIYSRGTAVLTLSLNLFSLH